MRAWFGTFRVPGKHHSMGYPACKQDAPKRYPTVPEETASSARPPDVFKTGPQDSAAPAPAPADARRKRDGSTPRADSRARGKRRAARGEQEEARAGRDRAAAEGREGPERQARGRSERPGSAAEAPSRGEGSRGKTDGAARQEREGGDRNTGLSKMEIRAKAKAEWEKKKAERARKREAGHHADWLRWGVAIAAVWVPNFATRIVFYCG